MSCQYGSYNVYTCPSGYIATGTNVVANAWTDKIITTLTQFSYTCNVTATFACPPCYVMSGSTCVFDSSNTLPGCFDCAPVQNYVQQYKSTNIKLYDQGTQTTNGNKCILKPLNTIVLADSKPTPSPWGNDAALDKSNVFTEVINTIRNQAGTVVVPFSTLDGSNVCPAGNVCISVTLPNGGPTVTAGQMCPAGYYCPGGLSTTPYECGQGSFCPAGSAFPKSCTIRGAFCDKRSSTQPPCPAGHYCETTFSKQPCPLGTYNPTTGNVSSTACITCPAGRFCPSANVSPGVCGSGYYCPAGSGNPTLCGEGFYCATSDTQIRCPAGVQCPPGTTTNYRSLVCNRTEQPNLGWTTCQACANPNPHHIWDPMFAQTTSAPLTLPPDIDDTGQFVSMTLTNLSRGANFINGTDVLITNSSTVAIRGTVKTFSESAGVLEFYVTSYKGTGTFTGWLVQPAGCHSVKQCPPHMTHRGDFSTCDPCPAPSAGSVWLSSDPATGCATYTCPAGQIPNSDSTTCVVDPQVCTQDSTCQAGTRCYEGRCVSCDLLGTCPTCPAETPIWNGTSCINCTAHAQCSLGKYCNNGVCTNCLGGFACQTCTGTSKLWNGQACVQCISSADCPDNQTCDSFVCANRCTSNVDCAEGWKCSNGSCTQCQPNTTCPSCPVTLHVWDGYSCSDCLNDNDCPDGKFCLDYTCTSCSKSNVFCRGCPSSTPVWNGSSCRTCANNTECGEGKSCASGVCQTCTPGQTCAGCPPNRQYWDGTQCTQCVIDDNCPTGYSCDATTKSCTPGCVKGQTCFDCVAPTQYWDGTQCVQCANDKNCGAGYFCQSSNCASCGLNDSCGGCPTSNTYWDGSGCVQCIVSSNCPANQKCSSKKCVNGCNTDADCSVGKFCSAGNCTNCATGSLCATCTGKNRYYNGTICVECTTNTHCKTGYNCVNNACANVFCPAATPYWVAASIGNCVQCLQSFNCSVGKYCSNVNYTCQTCQNSSWCPTCTDPFRSVWNTTSNVCVPCVNDVQCQQGDRCVSGACVSCPSGNYSNALNLNLCTPCPPGNYCPNPRSTVYSMCPAGSNVNTQGAVSQSDCTACPRGTYAIAGSSMCTLCPAGTMLNATGGTSLSSCSNCAAGSNTAALGSVSCTPCPDGYYSLQKAAFCTQCSTGYISIGGGTGCQQCAAGTYLLNNTCQSCPDGKTSAAGSVGINSCTNCSAGYYSNDNTSHICTTCPAGTYSSAGSGSCSDCGQGQYSTGTASACTNCGAGYIYAGTKGTSSSVCSACPVGTSSSAAASGSCTDCSAGYYQGGTGQSSCNACGTGYYQDLTKQTSCKACAAGYYQDVTGQTSCKACPVNTYNPNTASGASSACLACPDSANSSTKGLTGVPSYNYCKCDTTGTYGYNFWNYELDPAWNPPMCNTRLFQMYFPGSPVSGSHYAYLDSNNNINNLSDSLGAQVPGQHAINRGTTYSSIFKWGPVSQRIFVDIPTQVQKSNWVSVWTEYYDNFPTCLAVDANSKVYGVAAASGQQWLPTDLGPWGVAGFGFKHVPTGKFLTVNANGVATVNSSPSNASKISLYFMTQ
mgnify:CR=1 FL=1